MQEYTLARVFCGVYSDGLYLLHPGQGKIMNTEMVAIDSLLQIYTSVQDSYFKGIVLDAIEMLAGRPGLRVRAVGIRLEASIAWER